MNIRSLYKYGKTTYDLLVKLTKEHLACKDYNFRKYINSLITRHENDEGSDLTPNLLIVYTANKFKILKQTR